MSETTGRMTAERLTSILGGVWNASNGTGRARCPGHDGGDNNFRISTGADGNVHFTCHSHGCTWDMVMEGLRKRGIQWRPVNRAEDKARYSRQAYDQQIAALEAPYTDQHMMAMESSYRQAEEHEEKHGKFTPMVVSPAAAAKLEEQIDRIRMADFHKRKTFHRYMDSNGDVFACMIRTQAYSREGIWVPKDMSALSWGRVGFAAPEWHWRFLPNPLPLYGIERLNEISQEHGLVIVHEGELKADMAQEKFGYGQVACLSIMGGAERAMHADVEVLEAYANVVYWPDNDAPGFLAMRHFIKKVPHAWVINVDDLAPGEDAADNTFQSQADPNEWIGQRFIQPLTLRQTLSSTAWTQRKVDLPKPMLGELITSITRMFIVGATGLGKTMLALAMAVAIASGRSLLHWEVKNTGAVLYIDGEMAPIVTRQRIMEEQSRASYAADDGNLMVYSRMWEDELLKLHPEQRRMPPLNTAPGYKWFCETLDTLGNVDVVFLDNIMSLLEGIQRDEEAFKALMPIVEELSRRGIALVCLDHTGHNRERQYGAASKQWRFDTVGMMTAIDPDTDAEPEEYKGLRPFKLSFDAPHGKARTKTPQNWQDFKQQVIGLKDDVWYCDTPGRIPKIKPSVRPFLTALREVAVLDQQSNQYMTTRQDWLSYCEDQGLLGPHHFAETAEDKRRRQAPFRNASSDLSKARFIVMYGEKVLLLAPTD